MTDIKTKEEILWMKPQKEKGVHTEKYVLEAMDEYAKEVAIAFCDWLDMHRYEFETKPSEENFNRFYSNH